MSDTLASLIPDERNANRHSERGVGMVENSLRTYGAGRSILIDKNRRIIAGNLTAEQAGSIGMDDIIIVPSDGTRLIAVQRTDLDLLTDDRAKLLAIADNRSAEVSLDWDADVIKALSDEVDLSGLFSEQELAAILDEATLPDTDQAHATLSERFGVPPFSVLDARQGYWQERKRAWLGLGIQSEIGRGGGGRDTSSSPNGDAESRRDAELYRNKRTSQAVRSAAPGGSMMPACDYSAKQRGDGRGRKIT